MDGVGAPPPSMATSTQNIIVGEQPVEVVSALATVVATPPSFHTPALQATVDELLFTARSRLLPPASASLAFRIPHPDLGLELSCADLRITRTDRGRHRLLPAAFGLRTEDYFEATLIDLPESGGGGAAIGVLACALPPDAQGGEECAGSPQGWRPEGAGRALLGMCAGGVGLLSTGHMVYGGKHHVVDAMPPLAVGDVVGVHRSPASLAFSVNGVSIGPPIPLASIGAPPDRPLCPAVSLRGIGTTVHASFHPIDFAFPPSPAFASSPSSRSLTRSPSPISPSSPTA